MLHTGGSKKAADKGRERKLGEETEEKKRKRMKLKEKKILEMLET